MDRDLPALRLFGHPTWRLGADENAVALPEKAFALIGLLHLAFDKRASRPALAAWLYDDTDQAGALANLRQLLSRIRRRQGELGTELISGTANEVRLAVAGEAPHCDLAVFQELAIPRDESELRSLVSLYRGDLLENLAGYGAQLDGWIAAQRSRMRERYAELTLAGANFVRGASGEAALRRLVDMDPYREEAWRKLIDLRAESQGTASAKVVFEEMRDRFGSDLGSRPDEQTIALMSDLRRRGHNRAWSGPTSVNERDESADVVQTDRNDATVPKLCLLMPTADGAEATQASLAEALIEDVTLGLCRLRSISVIAPHTAWRISAEPQPSDRFGIGYFGETSLRNFGERPRLVVKLVRAADRVVLWADEFSLAAGMPPEHYRDLSRSIVAALASGVERAETVRFETTRQPNAYHSYLTGRGHLRTLDLPSVRRARRAFAEAAELAPAFVPTLNGIARTLILEWLLLARTEKDLLHQASRVAARAVEIDPFNGEAVREAANACLFLGGLDAAVEGFAKAERLAPHHADILADHSNALTHASELRPALERIELAIELNPISPDNYLWKAAGTMFFLEDYDDALRHLRRMRQPEPAFRLMAACLAMSGRDVEAAGYVRKALENQPNFRIEDWAATIPLKSKDHIVHYVSALRIAGFA